jgi:hypothetical protein
MASPGRLWLVVLTAALTACTVVGLRPYPAAGVFAATAVGATALNRAATGDCWSSCPYGGTCDRATGFCTYANRSPADEQSPISDPDSGSTTD